MERRHVNYRNPRIVRKLLSPPAVCGKPGAAAAAEIGSRVFPLRAPSPVPMPSVGSRRSTNIFVPKLVTKSGSGDRDSDGGKDSRVLRSGRNLAYPEPQSKPVHGEDEWRRLFGSNGADSPRLWNRTDDEREDLGGGAPDGQNTSNMAEIGAGAAALINEEQVMRESLPVNNRFGIVYRRKRLSRQLLDANGLKHGISFARKHGGKKIKLAPGFLNHQQVVVARRRRRGSELKIQESSKNLANKVGIVENDLLTGFADPMMLVVLVEAFQDGSSECMLHLLNWTVSWMRMNGFQPREFFGFLLSGSVASSSSEHGVHLLPMPWRQKDFLLVKNSGSSCGLCKIYGAMQSVPLLWLEFSALPSYFKMLHFSLGYLPCSLVKYSMRFQTFLPDAIQFEDSGFHELLESRCSGYKPSVCPVERKESEDIVLALESVVRQDAILPDQGLLRHRRKRSSSRQHIKIQNRSLMISQARGLKLLSYNWNRIGTHTKARAPDLLDNVIEPPHVELADTSDELMSYKDDSDVSNPLGSNVKRKQLTEIVDQVNEKELKVALTEVKKNILSACCNANVLVTDADKCWREEGFEVMLYNSSSGWRIAIKSQGMLRYLHKPQVMKPYVVNRFTHAYMWKGEDCWKLEFPDKWNWSVFKELHSECCERIALDVPPHVVHVPGVKEVSGCEDYATSFFIRPVEYIQMMGNEVQRALVSEVVQYDMDSGDEEWLNALNLHSSVGKSDFTCVSEETFEKMIYTFEKDRYTNDTFDRERALSFFPDFENKVLLVAMYDYWIEKRNRRNSCLMRVFQVKSPEESPKVNPCSWKKGSLKRQRSQTSRAKPKFLEALANYDNEEHEDNEDTLRRVQKVENAASRETSQSVRRAENAASRALETAIRLRSRAQFLMEQADLATYKSVEALRIAEAIQVSEQAADHIFSGGD